MIRLILHRGVLLASSILVAVSACNYRRTKEGSETLQSDRPGARAFRETVYAHARSQCVQCHASRQPPLFAQDSVDQAYNVAKTYVDFQNIPSSIFVFRTTNGHCGEACRTDGSHMEQLIQEWYERGEKGDLVVEPAPEYTIATDLVDIPPKLEKGPRFQKLSWAVPGFADVRFSVEVEWFDPVSFRFRKPRLHAGADPLRISGIRLVVGDHADPSANAYLKVNAAVGAGEAPVLSSKHLIVPRPGGETFQVKATFAEISVATEPFCKELAVFEANVAPTLNRVCATCHGSSDNRSTFALVGDAAADCMSAVQRISLTSPIDSPLIVYPMVQAGDHPRRALTRDDASKFEAWIRSER